MSNGVCGMSIQVWSMSILKCVSPKSGSGRAASDERRARARAVRRAGHLRRVVASGAVLTVVREGNGKVEAEGVA